MTHLRQLATKFKVADRTLFTGYLGRAEVASLMRDSTVFVFPSLTDTQGLVVLEACASSLPIVACEADISEAIRPGRNALIARNQPRDLARCVLEILSDPALLTRMGRASRILARDFTASAQARQMLELYRKVTDQA